MARRRSRDGGAAHPDRHCYAREKGLGNLFIGKISLQQTLVMMAMAIAPATALLGLQGLRARADHPGADLGRDGR